MEGGGIIYLKEKAVPLSPYGAKFFVLWGYGWPSFIFRDK